MSFEDIFFSLKRLRKRLGLFEILEALMLRTIGGIFSLIFFVVGAIGLIHMGVHSGPLPEMLWPILLGMSSVISIYWIFTKLPHKPTPLLLLASAQLAAAIGALFILLLGHQAQQDFRIGILVTWALTSLVCCGIMIPHGLSDKEPSVKQS